MSQDFKQTANLSQRTSVCIPVSLDCGDEKLRSIGIWPRIHHGHGACNEQIKKCIEYACMTVKARVWDVEVTRKIVADLHANALLWNSHHGMGHRIQTGSLFHLQIRCLHLVSWTPVWYGEMEFPYSGELFRWQLFRSPLIRRQKFSCLSKSNRCKKFKVLNKLWYLYTMPWNSLHRKMQNWSGTQ